MNNIGKQPIRIVSVKTVSGFLVELEFTDGSKREVDLEGYLHGAIFDQIRSDATFFNTIQVDRNSGTICWANGADIDPDVLYFDLEPAWAEAEPALTK